MTALNRHDKAKSSFAYPNLLTVETWRDVQGPGNLEARTTAIYDGFGRLVEDRQYVDANTCSSDSYVRTTRMYDGAGRVWKASNPGCASAPPVYTQTAYDVLGRVTDVTLPGGAVIHTTWADNVSTTKDPDELNHSAVYQKEITSDALGRITSVKENGSFITTYTYNALDNLVYVAQGGQYRAFGYDTMGRLTSADNPEASVTPTGRRAITYTYDNADNLLSRTDASGNQVSYEPDELNRVKSKTTSEGKTSFNFDQTFTIAGETAADYPIGRMTSATKGNFSTGYRYDDLGRFQASQQTVDSNPPYIFHYDYVPAGISGMKYPSGRYVTTTYDNSGRQKEVTGYVTGVQYAPHGALSGLTLANNVMESWTFNARLQPTCLVAGLSAAQPLLRVTNSYTASTGGDPCSATANTAGTDNNGNVRGQGIRTGWKDAGNNYQYRDFNLTYAYGDQMNRITSAIETNGQLGWNQIFSYDTWGNRTASSSWGNSIWTPAGWDGATNRATGTGWGYDGAGNLNATPFASMTYDPEGRLATFQSATLSVNDTYGYDAEGRRVKAMVGGTQTIYVYDAMGQLAAEYGGAAVAAGTQYLTADHLGSTRLVTGGGGVVQERHDYAPFGDEVAALGCGEAPGSPLRSPRCGEVPGYISAGVRLKFTGKERDAETGLDYFGARYFSGAQGRFTSADLPFAGQHAGDPQTWNLYSYGRNNPLRFVDPDGHDDVAVAACNDNGPCVQKAANARADAADYLIGAGKRALSTAIGIASFGLINVPALEPGGDREQVGADLFDVGTVVYLATGGLPEGSPSSTIAEGPVLNLGSGTNPMPGAVNVDIRPGTGVNVIADANQLPFANETFRSAHSINPYGFNPASAETARVLQPGGDLFVTGTPRNPFASGAGSASFQGVSRGPMIPEHSFGVQRTTSGGQLRTGDSFTSLFRKRLFP